MREAAGYLKRSDTDQFKKANMLGGTSVTFAKENESQNHKKRPLVAIDEIREQYLQRSLSKEREAQYSPPRATQAAQLSRHSNRNDISSITINSNRLDESVKAPGRPPMRIKGLTQYLVDMHYKKFGVYTKTGLFEFWKEHVSVIYRRMRNKVQRGAVQEPMFDRKLERSIREEHQGSKKSFNASRKSRSASPKKANEDLPPYEENVNFESLPLIDYSRIFEMDAAYTIQKDLDEENDEAKKLRFIREQDAKASYEKSVRDEELKMIKWAIDAYYQEVKDLLMTADYDLDKQDEQFAKWHHRTAEWLLNEGVALNSTKLGGTIPTHATINQQEQENKQPNSQKTPEEIAKNAKIIEARDKSISEQIKDESTLLMNLLTMLRDQKVYTNDPSHILRAYQSCLDKQRHGIIYASDDKAQKVIRNFYKAERVFKRIQVLYFAKIQKEKKYKHLSLFGFYKQLNKHQKLLYQIDWPLVDSKRLVVSRIEEEHAQEQYEHLQQRLIHDKDLENGISVEEMCVRFETFIKLKQSFAKDILNKSLTETHVKGRKKLLEQVFGKQKYDKLQEQLNSLKPEEHLKVLAKPKDKWKRLKILMELRKKFKHDMVLEKMIKEELKSNKVFKFPEEYDLYDDTEDKLCKHMGEKGIQVKKLDAGQSLRDQFKALDDQDLYYLKQDINKKRQQEGRMQRFLIGKALQYLEQKQKRLHGQEQTIRMFVSDVYHTLLKDFKDIAEVRFPHITYGTNKNSETFKKSFPQSFKNYFFHLVKSHFKQKKGVKRLRNPPPTFILSAGRRCIYHDQITCPEGCPHATFNKKVTLKHTTARKILKEPPSFRSRVWRRNDFKNSLRNVLMTNNEMENCTFEPEAGSMSLTIDIALRANPSLRKDGLLEEPNPEAYVKKLGLNFEKSHPEVYKAGVLKRAHLMYKEGKFDDALKRLYDGFNVDSIRKRFDPKYMKRIIADQYLKKLAKSKSKEREGPGSTLKRVEALKDEPDSQKKMPEEDFENKRLIPILRQAFDLINELENRKKITENRIKNIERQQRRLKSSLKSFSVYKRSQTRTDISKGEKILFRTIMCPLREKCPKDIRPRWPTSNTKSITKFGEECPFAHHQMELKFPESIITKLSATHSTIKNLKGQISTLKPKEVFKPSGPLFECSGCNSKSSKHIGGPCNLCRYKEMANNSSAKFSDKVKADQFRRSLSKRETSDEREDQSEMKKIMKLLDLDKNFTIKFGLLKKACVLYFYGRINDAFDEVAKSAKIIQDQREIEKQKQAIIEKRWKFKLGLDDGFEFPMPIDQIDPAKVDEKFLKKLDLQGVAVSTLKLYIEQVAPQGKEEHSKHAFLNKCIEDFYLLCEERLEDKQNTIKKMKKQVEKLDEDADMLEAFGSSPERSPDKGVPGERRVKPKKTKMCPNLENKGGCSLPSWKCQYAHNPIELDLIPIETKMKNLQGVIQSQTQKLKNMKPLEPWKPVKSGEVIHTHLMDMTSKGKKRKGADGDDEEDDNRRKEVKRKSIFDRENIFRKPYEQNE